MKDESLVRAIKQDNTLVLSELLRNGADTNAKNEDGYPVFMYAIAAQKVEVVELLSKHGADPNMKVKNESALLIATFLGNIRIVRALINAGANVNYADEFGVTALQKAALKGFVDIASLLLDHGAHVNARQYNGTTALIIASSQGHTEVVRLLLQSHADPNLTRNNLSALAFATHNNYTKIIDLLKQSGATASSNSGGCFIATAIYGSYFAPEVIVFRAFRDRVLAKSSMGKAIIKIYYLVSPPIADFIVQNKSLKKWLRLMLIEPIVKWLRRY